MLILLQNLVRDSARMAGIWDNRYTVPTIPENNNNNNNNLLVV